MSDIQQPIITAAAAGALVLTANKRLARHLVYVYDERMRAEGREVWRSPQILSFDGWLHRCIADLGESWRLLEGFPALRLWEQVIEEDSSGSELELLQLVATARKAQEAHQWAQTYSCQLDFFPLTEDQQAFRRWRNAYLQTCRKHHWLDRSELPTLVFAALNDGRLSRPAEVLLLGFDQRSPELDGLRRVVEAGGGRVAELAPLSDPQARIGRFPCADARQEIELAARWARRLLDQGATSIGIVAPDLKARRREIERIFRRQVDPAADLSLQDEETAFSLSLGAPLSEQGPVYAALEILSVGYRLTLEQASFLLRTPYLGSGLAEADQRALLDCRLRSYRQQLISLKSLSEQAARDGLTPGAAKIFNLLRQDLETRPHLLPGAWGEHFSRLLQAVGWPHGRSLSSYEYQMVKAWADKLMPVLASLDAVSLPVDRPQALGLLRRLAAEIPFQPESPTGPIQVVETLESSGLDFDHLWVMGVGEATFPAPARPNPFLPIALQVEKGMPHGSAERELQFARNVMQRLKAAGRQVIFSYPLRNGDCPLRPSPLIAELPVLEPLCAAPQDAISCQAATSPELETLADLKGPPLTAERGEGGTAILKDQALCPFRAFAHHRLRAQAFDQAQPGLDPLTRGQLVHRALENFWGEVKDQQRLLQLDDRNSYELIERTVEQALADYFAERGTPPQPLLAIESSRLQALLSEWLREVEQLRPPFSVLEREQAHFEQIGPLKIRTIVDRVDRLADGSRVILDYKTGQVKADSLLAERLLEPQLPIYAIADESESSAGVAFAQLRRGDCQLSGIARDSGLLPKVPGVAESKQAQGLALADWPQVITHWRRQLEQLANDFVAGQAAVDPVAVEIACKFCDLAGLCRISEAQPEALTPEGES